MRRFPFAGLSSSGLSIGVAVAVALSAAACAVPDSQFEATPDGNLGGPGGSVMAIVPSATSLTLDEGGEAMLTVTLSQPPAAPLRVTITTPSAKLALGQPELTFTAENYATPQQLAVTALADADTAAETAELTLSAPDVARVTVTASVRDDDTLQILTNIGAGGVITINETGAATVRVRLSAQPSADVRVEALVAAGPVSSNGPSSRIFTAGNYDVDQTFTFAAADDANIVTEDVALTLRAAGVPDKVATLRAVDDDVLNIVVAPSALEVTEQGSAGVLNVSLTQQPPADVTVQITTTTGQATVDLSQVTFTPQNYATARRVEVTAPGDLDIADGSDTLRFTATGLTERTAAITIRDNDIQQILTDAANPHLVAENGTAAFNVTLRYRPTTDVVVSVTSLASGVATVTPGVLRFTSTNYNQAHPVTVRGSDDNNLAPSTTSIRLAEASLATVDVPVSVSDDDTQRFVLSATTLSVPEGTTRTFDVSLAYDPGTSVTCTVVSSNPASLPVSPATLSFTSASYATPVRLTVAPPVDANNVSETATITMSGCGAPTAAAVAATAADGTVLLQYGWPTPFPASVSIPNGMVIAYKVSIAATSKLDSFGVFVPAASGDFRMALYANNGAPTTLVAQMPARRPLSNGSNTADITPDPVIPAGDYWLVLRVGQSTAVGSSAAGVTGTQCLRNVELPNLDDPWPSSFGASSCTTDRLLNLWINNYSQP
jgi:hypothetical protein